MKSSPLLSIVMSGRNDNYLGNFTYRLSTSLNIIAQGIFQCGCENEVEILVVDWNSDVPLAQDLPLTAEAEHLVSFVSVPPEVARQNQEPGAKFNPHIAINVGIRRSTGDYVLVMPADVIFLPVQVKNLVCFLLGGNTSGIAIEKSFFGISRQIVPWQLTEKELPFPQLLCHLELCARHFAWDLLFVGLCGGWGACLAHRSIWNDVEGIKETVFGWGWVDIDLGLRANFSYPTVDLLGRGVWCLDMFSSPAQASTRKVVQMPLKLKIEGPNQQNPMWGLREETLVKSRSNWIGPVAKGKKIEKPLMATIIEVEIFLLPLWHAKRKWAWSEDQASLASLVCLLSFSNSPIQFLEIVEGWPVGTFACAKVNPTIRAFLLDPFSCEDGVGKLLEFHEAMYSILQFHGYLQMVPGPLETALDRLKGMDVLSRALELVVVSVDAYGKPLEKEVRQISAMMAPAGVMVFWGKSSGRLKITISLAKKLFPAGKIVPYNEKISVFFLELESDQLIQYQKLFSMIRKWIRHKEKMDIILQPVKKMAERIFSQGRKALHSALESLRPKRY